MLEVMEVQVQPQTVLQAIEKVELGVVLMKT